MRKAILVLMGLMVFNFSFSATAASVGAEKMANCIAAVQTQYGLANQAQLNMAGLSSENLSFLLSHGTSLLPTIIYLNVNGFIQARACSELYYWQAEAESVFRQNSQFINDSGLNAEQAYAQSLSFKKFADLIIKNGGTKQDAYEIVYIFSVESQSVQKAYLETKVNNATETTAEADVVGAVVN